MTGSISTTAAARGAAEYIYVHQLVNIARIARLYHSHCELLALLRSQARARQAREATNYNQVCKTFSRGIPRSPDRSLLTRQTVGG